MDAVEEAAVKPVGEVNIRQATVSDKTSVLNILPNCYRGLDYLPSRYDRYLTAENNYAFVAESAARKLVGFLFFTVIDNGRSVVFRGKRVSEAFQGYGIMTKLVQHAKTFIAVKLTDVQKFISVVEKVNSKFLDSPNFLKSHRILSIHKFIVFNGNPVEMLDSFRKNSEWLSKMNFPLEYVKTMSEQEVMEMFDKPVGVVGAGMGKLMVGWQPYQLTPANYPIVKFIENPVFRSSGSGMEQSVSVTIEYDTSSGHGSVCDVTTYCLTLPQLFAHLVTAIHAAATSRPQNKFMVVETVFCNKNLRVSLAEVAKILTSLFGIEPDEPIDVQDRNSSVLYEQVIRHN